MVITISVATTIIENGLDVPNANTMFINNAHNFGLSDLHQMRGKLVKQQKSLLLFHNPPLSSMSSDSQKELKL